MELFSKLGNAVAITGSGCGIIRFENQNLAFAFSRHRSGLIAILVYVVGTVILALLSWRKFQTANDYLNATGTLSTALATISFLASNCGALEVLGLSGIAARYGLQDFHFYWIGAIPAMIFVSFVILPVYMRSGVRSVPEYLGQRFGPHLRLFNACTILLSTVLYAGVSLYALAEVMDSAANWQFLAGVGTFAAIVLAYVLIGGFRAAVYNEVLQFLLMLAGLVPLLYLSLGAGSGQGPRIGDATCLGSTVDRVCSAGAAASGLWQAPLRIHRRATRGHPGLQASHGCGGGTRRDDARADRKGIRTKVPANRCRCPACRPVEISAKRLTRAAAFR